MLNTTDTTIVAIDIQDKLVNMLSNKEIIKSNSIKLLKTADILNIDTILTEQYPKGLGNTIDEIKSVKDFKTIEKTDFSAYNTIKQEKLKKNIIIFGIETHICVLQTVLDLLKKRYNVFVAADCSSSRNKESHDLALEIMKQKGAIILNLEIILFEFLKSSKHPNFKEIQALIK